MIDPEVKCSKASALCNQNCPLLRLHMSAIEQIDESISELSDTVMGPQGEEAASVIHDALKHFGETEIDQDEILLTIRQGSGMHIEQLDALKAAAELMMNDIAEGCNGPLEAYGKDSAGRMIGAFVCRTKVALEGQSQEIATVFRYGK